MITFGFEQVAPHPCTAVLPFSYDEFIVHKEEAYLLAKTENEGVIHYTPSQWEEHKHLYDLLDDPRTSSPDWHVIFITMNDAFYTAFHDLIPIVLKIHKAYPYTYFIIHNTMAYGMGSKLTMNSRSATTEYIRSFLDHEGVTYFFHEKGDSPVAFKVTNLIRLGEQETRVAFTFTSGDIKNGMEAVKNHVLTEEERQVAPYRKVYLSRRHLDHDRTLPGVEAVGGGENRVSTDIRMDNEETLENYFRGKGYEIVTPEEKFKTIEDQVKFFNQTKILVGLTGTGLANGHFMQKDQIVVDIGSELAFEDEKWGVLQVFESNHYLTDSYMQETVHILIPSRRNAAEVIERIEKVSETLSL